MERFAIISEKAVCARQYWQLFRVLEGRRSGAGAGAVPDVLDVALLVSTLCCTVAVGRLNLLLCTQPACLPEHRSCILPIE